MFVENKIALITGAASGLGLAFAQEFLKNGLKGVSLVDVNAEKGEDVVASLEKEYGPNKAIFLKADVTNQAEFEDAFERTIDAFHSIDIVVNNAGISDENNFKKVIDVNLTGVLTGTSLAIDRYLPKYKAFEHAVIINISSIYGLDGCPFGTAYSAAKHGVLAIGKCLSAERHYKATGVKILTICPGFTATALIKNTDTTSSVLPGRYKDMFNEFAANLYIQQPDVVSRAVTKILENFDTGDVWIIEDDQCYQVQIPERLALRKIKTLEI